MASNIITANSKKISVRTAPPPKTLTSDPTENGTVLLRNPLPKYSFEKKYAKEKKQTTESKDKNTLVEAKGSGLGPGDKSETKGASGTKNKAEVLKPDGGTIADSTPRIGRLVNSFPQAVAIQDFVQSEDQSAVKNKAEPVKVEKPVNIVDPFSASEAQKLTHSVSAPAIDHQTIQASVITKNQSSVIRQRTLITENGDRNSASTEDEESRSNSIVQGADTGESQSAQNVPVSQLTSHEDKIRQLEEEKQLLKNQLDVQLQINQELKKLLVASVGEDLHRRVERLMTERAQLSLELGDFSKRQTEDYEHLDKLSIQADMWRSKYMASRVMTDELAAAKAFYSMQFQESQMALQGLLNERHEVKACLYEAYRGLQQVQEAFDPLNTQSSSSRTLTSKNIIDLARTNQMLVDRIKYRLLPSHVTSSLSNKMDPDWHDYLTQAEAHAQELLSREMRPEDFRFLPRSAIMAPGMVAVDRYHPCTNFDNLTLNVCCKCKGEIRVV